MYARLELTFLVNILWLLGCLQFRRSLKTLGASLLLLLGYQLHLVDKIPLNLVELSLECLAFLVEPLFSLCELFLIHRVEIPRCIELLLCESLFALFQLGLFLCKLLTSRI